MAAAEVLGTGADLGSPKLLRDVTEGRLVNLGDADVGSGAGGADRKPQRGLPPRNPRREIAVRDMPVSSKIRSGGLLAAERLQQQIIIVRIAAPELQAFQAFHERVRDG